MNDTLGGMASRAARAGLLALGLTLGVVQARAGGLADGEYDCGGGYNYRAMGKVDIQRDRFRYRPFGEVANGFAPYSMDPNGVINWGGGFGGLDDPPARLVASRRQPFGFNVEYQGNPSGLVQTMSCHAPGK